MKQTLKSIATGLLLLAFSPSLALANEAYELTLKVDTPEVQLGQPFDIIINLKQAANKEAVPAINNLQLKGLSGLKELGEKVSLTTQSLDGKTAFFGELTKTVIPLKAGPITIGPAILPLKDEQGKEVLLETEVVEIKVTHAPPTITTPPPTTPITPPNTHPAALDPTPTEMPATDLPDDLPIQTDESSNAFFWGQLLALLGLSGFLYGRWYRRTMAQRAQDNAHEPLTKLAKIKPSSPFPKINDPKLLEKVRLITHDFYIQVMDVNPHTMTTEEIIITARERVPEKKLQELLEVLSLHDEHRFSGQPVNSKALIAALEKLFTV